MTTGNVTASKMNAPAGAMMAIRIPARTGPAIEAIVWNPASSALDEGRSSRGRRRAGHVEMAGRLKV